MPKPNQTSKSRRSPANQPPLILVHGFRGSPEGLSDIADILRQKGFTVYLPTIPPFGGSAPLDSYAPRAYADYLAKYIQRNHLARPVLIGHSMGSIIVAATASFYPELLNQRIILMSPISKRTSLPIRLISPLSGLAPNHLIDFASTKYLYAGHSADTLKHILKNTYLNTAKYPVKKTDALKAAAFSTGFCVTDFPLTQDILLLAGEHDHLISRSATLKAAQKLHAKATFLPHTGHLHNYEQPLATAEAIIDFLSI